jgi:GAF domain-containing protein
LQKAIDKISKTVAAAELATTVAAPPPPAPLPVNEDSESLRALANLARIVSGRPSTADVSSLIWSHLRHVVPQASCAFFLRDRAMDSVKVAFVAGAAGSMLQGLEMKLGDRMTGWVAEHQQPIVNSEAKLDLGSEASLFGLKYGLALPLVSNGELAGVLSLYNADAFREEQVQTLQFVVPHLGQIFMSIDGRGDTETAVLVRQPLRVVSSR